MISMQQTLDFIIHQTAHFLSEEVDIEINKRNNKLLDKQHFNLKQLTALISVSGDISLNIAFSFEDALINQILSVYTEAIEYTDDEHEEYIEETAADVINIVIGRAIADFEQQGTLVHISAPLVMREAKSIGRKKNVTYYSTILLTDYGQMRVTMIPAAIPTTHLKKKKIHAVDNPMPRAQVGEPGSLLREGLNVLLARKVEQLIYEREQNTPEWGWINLYKARFLEVCERLDLVMTENGHKIIVANKMSKKIK